MRRYWRRGEARDLCLRFLDASEQSPNAVKRLPDVAHAAEFPDLSILDFPRRRGIATAPDFATAGGHWLPFMRSARFSRMNAFRRLPSSPHCFSSSFHGM